MQLHPIPALRDNYIWLLHDAHGKAVVVDPGEAEPVHRELAKRDLSLTHILITHHHPDHIGGSAELARRHGARVLAPDDARIEHVDRKLADGDIIDLPEPDCRFHVLGVPGHTLSHLAFFGEGLLFSGDTLFSLGCGRLFEGTPEQMLASLDRLSVLPADTLVCCGHEYTVANAAFARTIEPDNAALAERSREASALRKLGHATLPVPLASEKRANPFLRIDSAALKSWASEQGIADDRVQRFAALRGAKDRFAA